MKTVIIPSITSHSKFGSTWRDKIAELPTLPISQIALFVTGLSSSERIECYARLLEVKRFRPFTIPFVHAVTSMCQDEFEFLMANFGTERFNLHPLHEYPLQHELSAILRQRISIENSSSNCSLDEKDLQDFAGICLDLSHFESLRRKNPLLGKHLAQFVKHRGVCANHLSGIQDLPEINREGNREYSSHHLTAECTIDYAVTIPEWMFAPVCALEVENPLKEQLVAIERLHHRFNNQNRRLAA